MREKGSGGREVLDKPRYWALSALLLAGTPSPGEGVVWRETASKGVIGGFPCGDYGGAIKSRSFAAIAGSRGPSLPWKKEGGGLEGEKGRGECTGGGGGRGWEALVGEADLKCGRRGGA